MFKLGLCSVTFRDLSVEKIIDISKQAGLSGIEWGGDIHVPPIPERAKQVAALTEQAGLAVTSYGSYYRLGHGDEDEFTNILKTAIQLKSPGIRVWAGKKGSNEATSSYWKSVVQDAKRIAVLCQENNIDIHLEYHGNTLTDTVTSTQKLLQDINRDNVFSYWQPAINQSVEERINSINRLQNQLSHIHVFYWAGIDKLPLCDGLNEWDQYLKRIQTNETRYLLLEFVKDDSIEQFYDDVKALKSIVTK
ncbi:MAG TPA: TIM barrel protein [Pseudogracilibacillus sp.]|nr:TIM barrel protein [Pseudogracilibacillus sp.]